LNRGNPFPRTLAIAALICAAAGLVAILFAARVGGKMRDIEVPWTAATRARAAEPLYRAEDQHYQFKYLPAFAVLAIPLGAMPLPTAKAAWFVTSVLLLAAVLSLSLRVLPERRKPAWILIGVTVVAMAKFYGHDIVLGQMNLPLCVFALLSILALRRGREAEAGIWITLAIVVKPYAAIFLPWIAARRRWPSVASTAVGLAVVAALPAVFYGVDGDIALHREWWRTVTASTAPNLTNQDNVSIAGMYAKWMGITSASSALTVVTSGALLALLALVFVRRGPIRLPEALEGGLLLTSIPLLSPQGWDYVFLLSTPAIMLWVNYEDRLPLVIRAVTAAAIAVVGLSLFDVMGRAAYAAFMALSVITVCFVVVIGSIATLRVKGVA
jgi:hypothetical protein